MNFEGTHKDTVSISAAAQIYVILRCLGVEPLLLASEDEVSISTARGSER